MNHRSQKTIFLLTGCLGMLSIGVFLAWSILKIPLGKEFGWNNSELALNFTLTLSFFCLGSLSTGTLIRRFHEKKVLLLAGLLMLFAFTVASFLNGKNILELYLIYAVMGGLGMGIAQNVLLSVINSWFANSTGTITGILLMCFGSSTLVFGNIIRILFSNESIGWRGTYRILAVIVFLIVLGNVFVQRFSDGEQEENQTTQIINRDAAIYKGEYTSKELIADECYRIFFLYTVFFSGVYTAVLSFSTDYALSLGAELSLAVTMAGVLSASNGIGRIICGKVIDLFGTIPTMFLCGVITLLGPGLAIASICFRSMYTAILALVVIGVSGGFSPPITSTFTRKVYGSKNYSGNFGVSNIAVIPGSALSTFAAMLAKNNSFMMSFILLLSCASIGVGLLMMLAEKMKRPT